MKFSKVRNVKTPSRGTSLSAGIDFFIPNDFEDMYISQNEFVNIPSGIKVNVPRGYMLMAFNKSGVALKGLQVGACCVDEDYLGEIHLHVTNIQKSTVRLEAGQKLVQFILIPVFYDFIEEVHLNDLYKYKITSERGEGGFGSTNK